MYLVDAALTINYTFRLTALTITVNDLDVVVVAPSGTMTYETAPLTSFIAPTTTNPGSGTYTFTPTEKGVYLVKIVKGISTNYTVIEEFDLPIRDAVPTISEQGSSQVLLTAVRDSWFPSFVGTTVTPPATFYDIKSNSDGSMWVGLTLNFQSINANSTRGAWYSTDTGKTWTPCIFPNDTVSSNVPALNIDSNNRWAIYGSLSAFYYNSLDGINWVEQYDAGGGSNGIIGLWHDSVNNYLISPGFQQFFASSDGGVSYTNSTNTNSAGIAYPVAMQSQGSVLHIWGYHFGAALANVTFTDPLVLSYTAHDTIPAIANGPHAYNPTTNTLIVSGRNITVGENNRLMRTTDTGTTWTSIIPDTYTNMGDVVAMVYSANESTFYCLGALNNYKSTDDGLTWVALVTGDTCFGITADLTTGSKTDNRKVHENSRGFGVLLENGDIYFATTSQQT